MKRRGDDEADAVDSVTHGSGSLDGGVLTSHSLLSSALLETEKGRLAQQAGSNDVTTDDGMDGLNDGMDGTTDRCVYADAWAMW